MADLLSALREFRVLEDQRAKASLGEAELARWKELRGILGPKAPIIGRPPDAPPAPLPPLIDAEELSEITVGGTVLPPAKAAPLHFPSLAALDAEITDPGPGSSAESAPLPGAEITVPSWAPPAPSQTAASPASEPFRPIESTAPVYLQQPQALSEPAAYDPTHGGLQPWVPTDTAVTVLEPSPLLDAGLEPDVPIEVASPPSVYAEPAAAPPPEPEPAPEPLRLASPPPVAVGTDPSLPVWSADPEASIEISSANWGPPDPALRPIPLGVLMEPVASAPEQPAQPEPPSAGVPPDPTAASAWADVLTPPRPTYKTGRWEADSIKAAAMPSPPTPLVEPPLAPLPIDPLPIDLLSVDLVPLESLRTSAPVPPAWEPVARLEVPRPPSVPPPLATPAPSFDLATVELETPDRGALFGAAHSASSVVAGEHRVVLHTVAGPLKRGTLRDADLEAATVDLLPQGKDAVERIPVAQIKAVFFMLAPGEKPPDQSGKRVTVSFEDGRQLFGFCGPSRQSDPGFFMIPADSRSNTARIYVFRAAVKSLIET